MLKGNEFTCLRRQTTCPNSCAYVDQDVVAALTTNPSLEWDVAAEVPDSPDIESTERMTSLPPFATDNSSIACWISPRPPNPTSISNHSGLSTSILLATRNRIPYFCQNLLASLTFSDIVDNDVGPAAVNGYESGGRTRTQNNWYVERCVDVLKSSILMKVVKATRPKVRRKTNSNDANSRKCC